MRALTLTLTLAVVVCCAGTARGGWYANYAGDSNFPHNIPPIVEVDFQPYVYLELAGSGNPQIDPGSGSIQFLDQHGQWVGGTVMTSHAGPGGIILGLDALGFERVSLGPIDLPFEEFRLTDAQGGYLVYTYPADLLAARMPHIGSFTYYVDNGPGNPGWSVSFSGPYWSDTFPDARERGDLNLDGQIDAADAGIMFSHWTGDVPSVPEPAVPPLLLLLASCRMLALRMTNSASST